MKLKILSASLMILFFCLSASTIVSADELPDEIAEILTESCPVMGGTINKNQNTIIDNKLYYFCCPGCIDMMKSSFEKYHSKLENATERNLRVTNENGKCPVTGLKAKLEFFVIDDDKNLITFFNDSESIEKFTGK